MRSHTSPKSTSHPAAPGRLNWYFAMLEMPSTLFPVHNWLINVPDKDKRDCFPGCSMLLLSFLQLQRSFKTRFLQKRGTVPTCWPLGWTGTFASSVWRKAQEALLWHENPWAEGWEFYRLWRKWLLWKTSVNDHLPAPADTSWWVCCLQRGCMAALFPQAQCNTPCW